MNFFRLIITISLLTSLQSVLAGYEQRSRQPVALTASGDYKWLYAANRSSGSISVIDTAHRSVVNEIEIGGRLSDIFALPDLFTLPEHVAVPEYVAVPEHAAAPEKGYLLALDEQNHQLVLLAGNGADWDVTSRLDVAHTPVRLKVDYETKRCFITSLWSQVVTVIDLSADQQGGQPRLRIAKELCLPFEPLEMCLANERKKLIVAGSFSSALAVVDTNSLEMVAVKKIPGHNIRGLAISGDEEQLLASQQELNPLARSTFDDVHWGNMISNVLVSFSLDDICDSEADALSRRVAFQLGKPGDAAGDPGPINVGPGGVITVVLSGVNEVLIGSGNKDHGFRRVSVGRRPNNVVTTPDGRLFVANTFSDSISIVDVVNAKQIDQVSLGPQPKLSLAERGEMLFFDSRLSHDGWMSCHSCHTDGHTNGQLNDNLSDGSFDAPKRVLSLLGVGRTGPWAWNGKVETLEQQVRNSIQKTMQGEPPTDEQIAALVAFLKTLPTPPLPTDITANQFAAEIHRGEELFHSLDCQRCHAPPTYTSPQSYDVGLTDSVGNKEFNPPSLRGVGRRHAFFHDSRATSLTDVLANHKHQLSRELSTSERTALMQFLRSI